MPVPTSNLTKIGSGITRHGQIRRVRTGKTAAGIVLLRPALRSHRDLALAAGRDRRDDLRGVPTPGNIHVIRILQMASVCGSICDVFVGVGTATRGTSRWHRTLSKRRARTEKQPTKKLTENTRETRRRDEPAQHALRLPTLQLTTGNLSEK